MAWSLACAVLTSPDMGIGRLHIGVSWVSLLGLIGCGAEEGPTQATVASASASSSQGSGETGSDDDDSDADGDTEGETGADADSDSDAEETGASDTNDSDTNDTGPPTGECDLDMEVAIQLTMDVSWPGGLAVLEGQGQIDAWLLATLTTTGGGVQLSGRMCDLALPDFQTGALAGGETYGTQFPPAIWTHPSMPTIDALATVSSADPGAVLMLERGAVVLGGMMADPLNDPWPATWDGVTAVDHDGDGLPGITAMAKTGGNYAYPRIDILNTNARAEALYIVSRTIMEFNGIIETCDTASGGATVTMENHAVGCRMVGGGSCSGGQTDTLDNNMPQFMVLGGHFELARLPDGATCADAVAEFP